MSGDHIHFIGIGGVGMAGLAYLLKSRGFVVSGCDLQATPRTNWLVSNGIDVSVGHSPAHLTGVNEVIVTPAVAQTEAEFAHARMLADASLLRVRFRVEVLAEQVNVRESIAVCGSHGKTTTATWLARLLLALGEKVSWCIGGETGNFPVAGVVAGDGLLVVEADESDGTLSLYRATTLVVTNCDYDHPDHFRTRAEYVACFEAAKRQATTVIESESLDWESLDFSTSLTLRLRACIFALPPHNRRNARAVIEVALRRGHSLDAIAAVLPSVVAVLPNRRFQRLWPLEGPSTDSSPVVVADYAHHPTEMKCAVEMARRACFGKLRVIFQPHRYSRTKALLNDFPMAFEGADDVWLCPTYAAFEKPLAGGGVADLHVACLRYWECRSPRPAFALCSTCDAAWECAHEAIRAGDLTLLLGAGDIINLASKVLLDFRSGC